MERDRDIGLRNRVVISRGKGIGFQISSLCQNLLYIHRIRLERTIDEISFARNSKRYFEERKNLLVNFWRTSAKPRARVSTRGRKRVIHERMYSYTRIQGRGGIERERERKERDAVSERRPRASRPSPLYRRPRRSHLSSSPRFTTSLLGHVCESPRYVFDLCAHLLALNAGGEGNRFRTD